jgi:hypothetical protein
MVRINYQENIASRPPHTVNHGAGQAPFFFTNKQTQWVGTGELLTNHAGLVRAIVVNNDYLSVKLSRR